MLCSVLYDLALKLGTILIFWWTIAKWRQTLILWQPIYRVPSYLFSKVVINENQTRTHWCNNGLVLGSASRFEHKNVYTKLWSRNVLTPSYLFTGFLLKLSIRRGEWCSYWVREAMREWKEGKRKRTDVTIEWDWARERQREGEERVKDKERDRECMCVCEGEGEFKWFFPCVLPRVTLVSRAVQETLNTSWSQDKTPSYSSTIMCSLLCHSSTSLSLALNFPLSLSLFLFLFLSFCSPLFLSLLLSLSLFLFLSLFFFPSFFLPIPLILSLCVCNSELLSASYFPFHVIYSCLFPCLFSPIRPPLYTSSLTDVTSMVLLGYLSPTLTQQVSSVLVYHSDSLYLIYYLLFYIQPFSFIIPFAYLYVCLTVIAIEPVKQYALQFFCMNNEV